MEINDRLSKRKTNNNIKNQGQLNKQLLQYTNKR